MSQQSNGQDQTRRTKGYPAHKVKTDNLKKNTPAALTAAPPTDPALVFRGGSGAPTKARATYAPDRTGSPYASDRSRSSSPNQSSAAHPTPTPTYGLGPYAGRGVMAGRGPMVGRGPMAGRGAMAGATGVVPGRGSMAAPMLSPASTGGRYAAAASMPSYSGSDESSTVTEQGGMGSGSSGRSQ